MAEANKNIAKWHFHQLANVGHVVTETAARMPNHIAVAAPQAGSRRPPIKYDSVTFSRLERASNQIAMGVWQLGVQPGARLALMVPPGIRFVELVFGLFKAGVVVILIDPGMGRSAMLRCLAEAKPQGLVGIRLAHLLRVMLGRRLAECRQNIVVDGRYWPGCVSAMRFKLLDDHDFRPLELDRESPAAIIFTTGSTGPPKGVLYRHRTFLEQARQIRDYFDIQPGSVDVSGFPLFALFNAAMGTTTVFPKMDSTRPANVDPRNIKDAIDSFGADQSFGSPALWNTVSRYAIEHDLRFPGIKRILSAGAPVPPDVLSRIKRIIHPDGQAYTPYGATEALPVACNSATVVLNETARLTAQGHGACVGARFPDIRWKVIHISDDPIAEIGVATELATGQIGELIVQGPVVTDQYVTQTSANAAHKIADGSGFWHRMGDVGYLDAQDRFWFCGRKSQRVITARQTLFTIVVEGIVNTHPKIHRSALVGVGTVGRQVPVLVIEPLPDHWPGSRTARKQLIDQTLEICQSNDKTTMIDRLLLRRTLPVDIRHNSKISREQLARWAANRI